VWPLLAAKERRDRKDVCFLVFFAFFRGYSFIQFALDADRRKTGRSSGRQDAALYGRQDGRRYAKHIRGIAVTQSGH